MISGKGFDGTKKRLDPGFAWNPLCKYPPNRRCFCGKTIKKAKKCCLPNLKPAIEIAKAKQLAKYMEAIKDD